MQEVRAAHEEETHRSKTAMEEYRSSVEVKTGKLFEEMKAEVGFETAGYTLA